MKGVVIALVWAGAAAWVYVIVRGGTRKRMPSPEDKR